MRRKHERDGRPAAAVAPTKSGDMSAISLITPSYRYDRERCELLCESVDRFVSGFARHYLVVADHDVPLFAAFNRGRREVIAASTLLPSWLKPMPSFVQRGRRRYWWSLRARPVSGWHVQQFVKIAAARMAAEEVVCLVDSDVVFFRPFDLGPFSDPGRTPLYIRAGEVAATAPMHATWIQTTHRLLGLGTPSFPADDFIGHVIFWNRESVRAMTDRIEAVTSRSWPEALCRAHAVSEYMLYGYRVCNDASLLSQHICTGETPCLSYWDTEPLTDPALERLLGSAAERHAAISVQSISNTPLARVRAVLDRLKGAEFAGIQPWARIPQKVGAGETATVLS